MQKKLTKFVPESGKCIFNTLLSEAIRRNAGIVICISAAFINSSCAPSDKNKSPASDSKQVSPSQTEKSDNGQGQTAPAPAGGASPVHKTDNIAGLIELKPLCGTSAGKKVADISAGRQVKIATFNMLGAFANSLDSLKARTALAASEIHKTNADVIGIQEAEDMDPAGLTVSQLAQQMTALSGETWYWCFFRSNPHVPLEADTQIGGGGLGSAGMAAIDANTKKLGQNRGIWAMPYSHGCLLVPPEHAESARGFWEKRLPADLIPPAKVR